MTNINGKTYAMNAITPMKSWKTPFLRLVFFLRFMPSRRRAAGVVADLARFVLSPRVEHADSATRSSPAGATLAPRQA